MKKSMKLWKGVQLWSQNHTLICKVGWNYIPGSFPARLKAQLWKPYQLCFNSRSAMLSMFEVCINPETSLKESKIRIIWWILMSITEQWTSSCSLRRVLDICCIISLLLLLFLITALQKMVVNSGMFKKLRVWGNTC